MFCWGFCLFSFVLLKIKLVKGAFFLTYIDRFIMSVSKTELKKINMSTLILSCVFPMQEKSGNILKLSTYPAEIVGRVG